MLVEMCLTLFPKMDTAMALAVCTHPSPLGCRAACGRDPID